MTPEEAAQRLGIPAARIEAVQDHPSGYVVEVRGAEAMLVTETVARRYVPEVDDEQHDRPKRTKK